MEDASIELADQRQCVAAAAHRGAASVTHSLNLIRQAVEATLDQWVDERLRGRRPADVEAWAFRVAANAVQRLWGAEQRRKRALLASIAARRPAFFGVAVDRVRAVLELPVGLSPLTERQREVAFVYLSAPSIHAAARELEIACSNLRRTMRRIERRLQVYFARIEQSGGKSYPPLTP